LSTIRLSWPHRQGLWLPAWSYDGLEGHVRHALAACQRLLEVGGCCALEVVKRLWRPHRHPCDRQKIDVDEEGWRCRKQAVVYHGRPLLASLGLMSILVVGENGARGRRSVRDLHIPHLRSHRDHRCRFCYASMSLERMQAEDCGVFLGVSPPRSVGDRGCSSFELVEVIRIVAAEHTALDLLDGATGEYDLS
jgi:hypothetical protein